MSRTRTARPTSASATSTVACASLSWAWRRRSPPPYGLSARSPRRGRRPRPLRSPHFLPDSTPMAEPTACCPPAHAPARARPVAPGPSRARAPRRLAASGRAARFFIHSVLDLDPPPPQGCSSRATITVSLGSPARSRMCSACSLPLQ
jgi:hypothetical protein